MVKKIHEFIGKDLRWAQVQGSELGYQLFAGDAKLGGLQFKTVFGTYATAISGDGCWTFKRVGFLKPEVTIRVCETDEEIGIYRNDTWSEGGTLELADGRKLQANTNFWQTDFFIKNGSGQQILHYQHQGGLRLSSKVKIYPAAADYPELPCLVIFGWYLIVVLIRESGSAVG